MKKAQSSKISNFKYWLRMLTKACPEVKEETRKLWKEAQELTLIFAKITSTMDKKK